MKSILSILKKDLPQYDSETVEKRDPESVPKKNDIEFPENILQSIPVHPQETHGQTSSCIFIGRCRFFEHCEKLSL